MIFTFEINDDDYATIDEIICVPAPGVYPLVYHYHKPEEWLNHNLTQLVKQCCDSKKKRLLEKLGDLTMEEIELIKKWRERDVAGSDINISAGGVG